MTGTATFTAECLLQAHTTPLPRQLGLKEPHLFTLDEGAWFKLVEPCRTQSTTRHPMQRSREAGIRQAAIGILTFSFPQVILQSSFSCRESPRLFLVDLTQPSGRMCFQVGSFVKNMRAVW